MPPRIVQDRALAASRRRSLPLPAPVGSPARRVLRQPRSVQRNLGIGDQVAPRSDPEAFHRDGHTSFARLLPSIGPLRISPCSAPSSSQFFSPAFSPRRSRLLPILSPQRHPLMSKPRRP